MELFNKPFTPEQITELEKPLDRSRVKHRPGGGGTQLSYIEGHQAIATANRIFGFGAWGFETLQNELCSVADPATGEICGYYYAARIRLTVAGCVSITEEGINAVQEGKNPRARIDAHDQARKGAITDALKRALRCYGDQFGLSLYDRDLVDGQPRPEGQTSSGNSTRPTNPASNNGAARPASPAPTPTPARVIADPRPKTLEEQLTARLRAASTESTLYDLWNEEVKGAVEEGSELYERLRGIAADRKAQLQAQKAGAK